MRLRRGGEGMGGRRYFAAGMRCVSGLSENVCLLSGKDRHGSDCDASNSDKGVPFTKYRGQDSGKDASDSEKDVLTSA